MGSFSPFGGGGAVLRPGIDLLNFQTKTINSFLTTKLPPLWAPLR